MTESNYRLQQPHEALAALRKLVATPNGRALSRANMRMIVAKGGPDLRPAGGYGGTSEGDASLGEASGSMVRELRAQGLKLVTR